MPNYKNLNLGNESSWQPLGDYEYLIDGKNRNAGWHRSVNGIFVDGRWPARHETTGKVIEYSQLMI